MVLSIRRVEILTPLIVMIVGVSAAIYLYSIDNFSLLYYGDSISHLVAGRKFVDWVNPGIAQIGTVWLPLLHIFLIPFSLNNFLFTSGLAGMFVSLPALGLASLYVVKLIYRWSESAKLSFFGGLIFALNPSVIYMGVISMQESLLLFFALASIYYIYSWYDESQGGSRRGLKYLYISAPLVILATLTRYEAWLLPAALTVLVIVRILTSKDLRNSTRYLTPLLSSFGGIFFWLGWNQLSYGDPFTFLNTPFYSYLAQATSRPFREFLFLQPLSSAQVLFTAMEVMYGAPLVVLSAIGAVSFIGRTKGKISQRFFFILLLGLPTLSTYIALLAGFGELFHQGGGIWFNSRFLVLASGVVTFGAISLVTLSKRRTYVIAISLMLILSVGFGSIRQLGYPNPPMVMKEAYAGFSYRNETFSALEISNILETGYEGGTILMLTSSGDAQKIMVFTGIPLRNYRDLFGGDPWPIEDGRRSFTDWTIISNQPTGDALLGVGYLQQNSVTLNKNYDIVASNSFFTLLRLKES